MMYYLHVHVLGYRKCYFYTVMEDGKNGALYPDALFATAGTKEECDKWAKRVHALNIPVTHMSLMDCGDSHFTDDMKRTLNLC